MLGSEVAGAYISTYSWYWWMVPRDICLSRGRSATSVRPRRIEAEHLAHVQVALVTVAQADHPGVGFALHEIGKDP
jgi:hypothetical protein